MTTKPATKPKRVTAADLERWDKLRTEAGELDRRVRSLRAEAARIEKQAAEDLKTSGRESVTRGGWRLAWTARRVVVSWKDAFIARCGAEAADELLKSETPKPKLQISPPESNAPRFPPPVP